MKSKPLYVVQSALVFLIHSDEQAQWFANGFFDELFGAKKMEDLWACKIH